MDSKLLVTVVCGNEQSALLSSSVSYVLEYRRGLQALFLGRFVCNLFWAHCGMREQLSGAAGIDYLC